jgi:hypothetical protein
VFKGETESGELEFEFLVIKVKVGIDAGGQIVELAEDVVGNFESGKVHGRIPFWM